LPQKLQSVMLLGRAMVNFRVSVETESQGNGKREPANSHPLNS
jgi:hypothetical protein